MTSRDRYIGIAILAVAVYMFFYVNTAEYPQFLDDPGPAVVPLVIAIGLTVCGIGLIFWPRVGEDNQQEENHNRSADKEEAITSDSKQTKYEKESGNEKQLLKSVVVGVTIIIYVILLESIGFMISTPFLIAFLIWYLSEKKNKRVIINSIITSIITTFLIVIVFENYLNILLP